MVHVGDLRGPATDPPHGDWSKMNKFLGENSLLALCLVSLKSLVWFRGRSRKYEKLKKKNKIKKKMHGQIKQSEKLFVSLFTIIFFNV